MKKLLWLLPLLFAPWQAQAADLANGERINRTCALCHGHYGQGTPSRASPRLAGQHPEYLAKATKDFRDGKRQAPTMVVTSGLHQLTDKDIDDVAAFLSQVDLPASALIDVQQPGGDPAKGVKAYKECKNCHGTEGMGKPDKKVPRIAGQHANYMFQQMKLFQWRKRPHGIDPDDQALFDDLDDQGVFHLVAHVATLDDEQVKLAKSAEGRKAAMEERRAEQRARHEARRAEAIGAAPGGTGAGLQITDIKQTVAQMEVKAGLKPDDVIQAMLSKAAGLNMKLVGQQYVSKELEERGQKAPYLTIVQFCDPEDAKTMVVHNPIYASYMPCRIAVVEDQKGKLWVMMLSLDMLINANLLPPEVVEIAIRVNQSMLDVMVAGATGEF